MMPPGLTAAEQLIYLDAMTQDVQVATTVKLLTLDHVLVSSVTPLVLDGQVNFADNADTVSVSRKLAMGFLDPDRSLRLDGNAPTEGVAGMDRLIQVTVHVFVPALGRWVGTDVFTGRPSQLDRDGDTVTVEAEGKECLHLRTVSGYQLVKGKRKMDALQRLLSGETRTRFPANITATLAATHNVGGPEEEEEPWKVAVAIAQSEGYQLFYDGSGYAVMRKAPTTPAWTLTERGANANVTTRIRTTTDLTQIRNRVVVTGRKSSGKPLNITPVEAPSAHPFSAESLKFGGNKWYNTAYYDETSVTTTAKGNSFAKARLTEKLTQAVQVQTTAIPVYHLEPGDLLRLEASTATFDFRFSESSLPLGPSDTGQTFGYQERVRSPSAGRILR